MADVTDATFETDVIERSKTVPVIVDLWAEWCGPCKQLGPILEKLVAATNGQVELAKVDVDANPAVAQAFKVQSIPAVHAMKDGQVVDSFMGAQGEAQVQAFIDKLLPSTELSEIDQLVAFGDEASFIKALEIQADYPPAVTGLAAILVEQGEAETGLKLLERIPESPETRRIAAMARVGTDTGDDIDATLGELLLTVKTDDDARQKFVDLLEVRGPDDPRTAEWRRKLSAALF